MKFLHIATDSQDLSSPTAPAIRFMAIHTSLGLVRVHSYPRDAVGRIS